VAGQFGFASAVPLLNQVNNLLQSRSTLDEARLPRDPRPESVGRGVICWPGGQSLPEGSENCRRRLSTWLLEGSEPPTLLLPEQEGIRGIRFPSGWIRRVSASRQIARTQPKKFWMSGRCRWNRGFQQRSVVRCGFPPLLQPARHCRRMHLRHSC
jgi:penicillin-binding protein 1C